MQLSSATAGAVKDAALVLRDLLAIYLLTFLVLIFWMG